MFANCDPRVATVDDLAGLVRAAKPQKMRETTRAQLLLLRENDELRKLQDENDELRDENDKLRARVEAAQVALFGFDESEDMPPSGPLGL